jgi:hypothetical protein
MLAHEHLRAPGFLRDNSFIDPVMVVMPPAK